MFGCKKSQSVTVGNFQNRHCSVGRGLWVGGKTRESLVLVGVWETFLTPLTLAGWGLSGIPLLPWVNFHFSGGLQ